MLPVFKDNCEEIITIREVDKAVLFLADLLAINVSKHGGPAFEEIVQTGGSITLKR